MYIKLIDISIEISTTNHHNPPISIDTIFTHTMNTCHSTNSTNQADTNHSSEYQRRWTIAPILAATSAWVGSAPSIQGSTLAVKKTRPHFTYFLCPEPRGNIIGVWKERTKERKTVLSYLVQLYTNVKEIIVKEQIKLEFHFHHDNEILVQSSSKVMLCKIKRERKREQ